jgi:peptidyl-prolyl cis-trans isomerase NIMA-interacting 1
LRGRGYAGSLRRVKLPAVAALASSLLAGCGSLTTSPSWVGGGMAMEAPVRHAAEDAAAAKERARVSKEPTEIGARHILVMHVDSKSKPETVTRSKEQARARAEEILGKLRAGTAFEALVKEYTDEPGGAERNGDLGVFDRAAMVKGFADAAFALKVGEVSNVVETQFGFHIIRRTE